MSRTARVTISPRYKCQGPAKAPRMSDARRRDIYGPLQTARSVWAIGGKPALFLFACGVVVTFAVVAFGG